jgi:hypothetical protein
LGTYAGSLFVVLLDGPHDRNWIVIPAANDSRRTSGGKRRQCIARVDKPVGVADQRTYIVQGNSTPNLVALPYDKESTIDGQVLIITRDFQYPAQHP